MGILYESRTTGCPGVRVFARKNVLEEPFAHYLPFDPLCVRCFGNLSLPASGLRNHLEQELGAR